MKGSQTQPNNSRGSILVIAMIFGALMLVTAGILLNFGVSEKAVNERHFMRLEAQAAAETAVEYGFAELQKRWLNKTNWNTGELQSDPLSIPTSTVTFFQDSNVEISSMEVVGGEVSAGGWRFINPEDPANMLDPQKQKRVFSRDVEVYGMASVNAKAGSRNSDTVAAYCAQLLEVRDAPLFGHAIFYNMDMEFHPGPKMDVYGPVHGNQNIYVQSAGGLFFHSNLMAAGHIWHRYKPTNSKSPDHLSPVQIRPVDGGWKQMYKGGGDQMDDSNYYDSTMGEDWKAAAEDRWGGSVATIDHEVPNMRSIAIKDYVPDDPSTGANELENHAYALIEPQLANSNPDYKGAATQKEQFSYKAGLLLRIIEDAAQPSGYDYDFYTYQKSIPSEANSARLLGGDGKPVEKLLDKVNLPANLVTLEAYQEDASDDPISGFYDMRQKEGMDLVEIDVGLLRTTVDSNDPSFDVNAWNGTFKLTAGSSYDWNGVMYVEIPTVAGASGRVDKVKKAKSGIAVRLKNGTIIPSPPGAPDEGFTVATNAPLYVLGDFNADGNQGSGSATEPDDANEKPAALIADAITILSNEWEAQNFDEKSKMSISNRMAKFTEVSAAFLTGQSSTIPGAGKYSGGVHNFPRFLERWTGQKFRYRGSLVSLFESEVNWKHMIDSPDWYSPPIRNWGFSSIFENGNFPPGTPMVRDFRRKHFRFLTEDEYVGYTGSP